MKFRRFGKTGWQVGEIGYGMWGMGEWSGSQDAESLASLQRAIELGCNFFDTAWAYGEGHSEELLGKALRANPAKRLYIATKVPPKNREWPSKREFSLDVSYPPEYVFEYVEKSLRNIGSRHAGPDPVPHLGRPMAGRRTHRADHRTIARQW